MWEVLIWTVSFIAVENTVGSYSFLSCNTILLILNNYVPLKINSEKGDIAVLQHAVIIYTEEFVKFTEFIG